MIAIFYLFTITIDQAAVQNARVEHMLPRSQSITLERGYYKVLGVNYNYREKLLNYAIISLN